MELKGGYKQTDVGVIPEDWDIRTLDSIAQVTSGKRLPKGNQLTRYPNGHPYIRVKDMRMGFVAESDIRFVPIGVIDAIRSYRIFQNELAISVAGTLGVVSRIGRSLHGANLTENANRISPTNADPGYLFYQLSGSQIQREIDEIKTVGAQPKLALTRLRGFLIPFPSLKEQRAIAEVLSDVDAEMESLAQRHEKLVAQKQGLSKELLSGRTRLVEPKSRGFNQTDVGVIPEDWKWCQLGDVALVRKGELIRRADGEEGSVPVISAGKRPSFFHSQSNRTGPVVTISASGANAGYVGLHEGEIFAADCSSIEAESDITTRFLGCYIQHKQQDIYSLQEGGAQPHVQPPDIIRIPVVVPPVLEQKLIVVLLGDVDAEIQAVAKLKAKLQAKKEGLMQTLLTGKIRLT